MDTIVLSAGFVTSKSSRRLSQHVPNLSGARHEGSYIDGRKISGIRLQDLNLEDRNGLIEVRIGVKSDATHVGGINIFGHKFGNYPQNILMRIRYQ